MNTIFVPTDFSPAAKNAAEYAARLCRELKGKLILFNAFMMPVPVSEVPYVTVTASEMQDEYEKGLRKEAERLFDLYDIEIEHSVQLGVPNEEIRAMAEEKGADLIVVGVKDTTGIDKLLGSTTDSLIRKSRVPVLAVPEGCSYSGFRSVAYATDLNYAISAETFSPLKKLLEAFGATLHIVHVQKPDQVVRQEDIGGKIKLTVLAENMPHTYHTVEDTNVEHGLEQFLEQTPVEILAMVAHKHNFFERLFGTMHTKSMLHRTSVPLLVLHD